MQSEPRTIKGHMGYTILLQWTWQPPPGSKVSLSDAILQRVLEHYGLTHPSRSTVSLRTYRSSTPDSTSTRYLTTVTYSPPVPTFNVASTSKIPRDDVMYLYLDDRPTAGTNSYSDQVVQRQTPNVGTPKSLAEASTAIEVDGFEIVDSPLLPKENASPQANTTLDRNQDKTQRIIAVRPAAAVLPLLQVLLSTFVLGMTKSARAAASTTAQTMTPTHIPGQQLVLTTLKYSSIPSPNPPIILSVHGIQSSPYTIFLEAEYDTTSPDDTEVQKEILKEFLEGCLGDVAGTRKWGVWDRPADNNEEKAEYDDGWEGLERNKRVTEVLCRCLREGGFI